MPAGFLFHIGHPLALACLGDHAGGDAVSVTMFEIVEEVANSHHVVTVNFLDVPAECSPFLFQRVDCNDVVNIAVDISYGLVNPRMRAGARGGA